MYIYWIQFGSSSRKLDHDHIIVRTKRSQMNFQLINGAQQTAQIYLQLVYLRVVVVCSQSGWYIYFVYACCYLSIVFICFKLFLWIVFNVQMDNYCKLNALTFFSLLSTLCTDYGREPFRYCFSKDPSYQSCPLIHFLSKSDSFQQPIVFFHIYYFLEKMRKISEPKHKTKKNKKKITKKLIKQMCDKNENVSRGYAIQCIMLRG